MVTVQFLTSVEFDFGGTYTRSLETTSNPAYQLMVFFIPQKTFIFQKSIKICNHRSQAFCPYLEKYPIINKGVCFQVHLWSVSCLERRKKLPSLNIYSYPNLISISENGAIVSSIIIVSMMCSKFYVYVTSNKRIKLPLLTPQFKKTCIKLNIPLKQYLTLSSLG